MYLFFTHTVVDPLSTCIIVYFSLLLSEKGLVLPGVYIPGGQVA